MYSIGLDTTGSFDQMASATTTGIHSVRHDSPAARAEVMTGVTISATTTGRMPLKIAVSVGLDVMVSGVRNIAIASIIINDGSMVPAAAAMLPSMPRSLSPTTTDMFTARMPGSDCATASRSRNSARSIHRRLSTISRSIRLIIAQPPPKVKAPILKNDPKSCGKIFSLIN